MSAYHYYTSLLKFDGKLAGITGDGRSRVVPASSSRVSLPGRSIRRPAGIGTFGATAIRGSHTPKQGLNGHPWRGSCKSLDFYRLLDQLLPCTQRSWGSAM